MNGPDEPVETDGGPNDDAQTRSTDIDDSRERRPVEKAPDAYRTISEVADALDVPQHVLRFWETKFTQVKPLKRAGGRRYYRPDDVVLLQGIRQLLYGDGYTLRGVQRILREKGVRSVKAIGEGARGQEDDGESVSASVAVPPVETPSMAAAPPPQATEPDQPATTSPSLPSHMRTKLEEALRTLEATEAKLLSRFGEGET